MAMMTWMRRTSRYFLIVVVVTFVGSLAYFGATQQRAGGDWMVSVNGEEISPLAYQQAYRALLDRYRQAFQDRFSEELARSLRLRDQVIEQLVLDRLIRQQAESEGIRVSDDELRTEITRLSVFHEDGRFSRDRYVRVLSRAGLSDSAFEDDLRGDLLRQKLEGLVRDGARVSEAELRQHWETHHARVRAAYLLVSPEGFLESTEVTDGDVEAYYEAHPAEFTRPERRRVLVGTVPSISVSAPTVTDSEVEAAYQARLSEFEQPERIRLAHILVRVPSVGGSEAEDRAKATAESLLERVREGAEFADVARESSEDAATAARGGEVGLVARGDMVPQLEEAAFNLEPGELGGPVRTPFGYHVVKVLELVPASKKELEEVAPTLRATLVAEKQLAALREKAEEVRGALLVAPDFAAEAQRLGLTVREIGPLGRTDPVEGIGRVSAATETIFSLPSGGVSVPVKVPDGYAIFRLLERQAPELQPLEEVRTAASRAVRQAKADEAARSKADELAAALRGGEDPADLGQQEGVTAGETEFFSSAEPLEDTILGAAIGPVALELPEGGVGAPVNGPQGVYVVKVTARERPNPTGFEKAREGVERDLLERKRVQAWQAWITALRRRATVEINRELLPAS